MTNNADANANTWRSVDIVERLRRGVERYEEGEAEQAMDFAAAEIERLRAERDEWKAKWIALAQAAIISGTVGQDASAVKEDGDG